MNDEGPSKSDLLVADAGVGSFEGDGSRIVYVESSGEFTVGGDKCGLGTLIQLYRDGVIIWDTPEVDKWFVKNFASIDEAILAERDLDRRWTVMTQVPPESFAVLIWGGCFRILQAARPHGDGDWEFVSYSLYKEKSLFPRYSARRHHWILLGNEQATEEPLRSKQHSVARFDEEVSMLESSGYRVRVYDLENLSATK